MGRVIAAHRHASIRGWSLLALLLAVAGEISSLVLIFSAEQDPASVRWWLVLLPLALAALPLAAPRRGARVGAAGATAAWCVVTGFSIGLFFLPCCFALVVAATREEHA